MIPPFDHNYVLPPYVGDNPTQRAAQSPYHTEYLIRYNGLMGVLLKTS